MPFTSLPSEGSSMTTDIRSGIPNLLEWNLASLSNLMWKTKGWWIRPEPVSLYMCKLLYRILQIRLISDPVGPVADPLGADPAALLQA